MFRHRYGIHRGACVCRWVDVHPTPHAKHCVPFLLVAAPNSFLPSFRGVFFLGEGFILRCCQSRNSGCRCRSLPRRHSVGFLCRSWCRRLPARQLFWPAPSEYVDHEYRVLVSPPTFLRGFVPLLVMCTLTLCRLFECPHCAPPLPCFSSCIRTYCDMFATAYCRRHTCARQGAARGSLNTPSRRLLQDSRPLPPCPHVVTFAMSMVFDVALCVGAGGAIPLGMQALCRGCDFCLFPPLLRSSRAHNCCYTANQSASFCPGCCLSPMWCLLWHHGVLPNGCGVWGLC